ncbi:MAG TPA: hypothetical protein VFC78_23870 [Tepidisphaeraceae bacterium]|nr:hypothetical protein [Tepidisphaeraceae bacterium]
MTILLSAKTRTRLVAEASRRGVPASDLAEQLIDAALPKVDAAPNQSSIDILNESEARTRTDDPQEMARRKAEFEEFKQELNETRLSTDGPEARVPFP